MKIVKLNLKKLMHENGPLLKYGGSIEYSEAPEDAYFRIVNDWSSIIAEDGEECDLISISFIDNRVVLNCSKTGRNLVLSKNEYDICCGEKVSDKEDFTHEELYILSSAMLKLIKNTNEAASMICDEESVDVLKNASRKYKILNDKIYRMIKD